MNGRFAVRQIGIYIYRKMVDYITMEASR